ncbi:MAG: TetR family transcriptional regulator C-terminal domain-containing protein [Bauldia sp.]|nr:TetR family transcriptional regulator C-terminal domain-containing protein [Bauldia sp.]
MKKGKTAARGVSADTRIAARNKKTILEAAIGVFTAKGYDGASIAEIAKRSGLPKANVYYYFGSKETIYRTIIGDLIGEWDRALDHLDPAREPAEAIAGYIRAKLDFSRRHAAQSRMFANEAVHGGRFVTRKDRNHMLAVTLEKAKVFEAWAAAGKMDPVDPIHLFILLWGATQYYADFDVLAKSHLQTPRLGASDFERAAETITAIVLKGCGVVLPGPAAQRGPSRAARLRG